MNSTEAKLPIIGAMRATGAGVREIGEATDLHFTQVARLLKKQEVRDIIRQCETAIAARGYKRATDNIIKAIEKYDPDSPCDGEDKSAMQLQEQGFRASLKVVEGMGLTPSNALAPMVQQINVAVSNQFISPIVDEMLARIAGPQHIVIDAEKDDE
jgi:hypothetical protein